MGFVSTLLSSLVNNGFQDIADVVFEKGEDFVKGKIKDVTGLELSDRLSEMDISKIKDNEEKILETLEERNRHQEAMARIELKELELNQEDRESARELNTVYIDSDDKFISRFLPIMTLIIIILSFVLMTAVIFVTIPEENQRNATYVINLVGFIVNSVVMFYYGKHSAEKKQLEKRESENRVGGIDVWK
jgi:hypothetical protein